MARAQAAATWGWRAEKVSEAAMGMRLRAAGLFVGTWQADIAHLQVPAVIDWLPYRHLFCGKVFLLEGQHKPGYTQI